MSTSSEQMSEITIDYCNPQNWHPAANLFPLMPDDELQTLAHDIKANGLRNPIIIVNGKVLDGRNRLLACKLAGVRPEFQPRNAERLGSPVTWVLSQNLHRRQLTATQRAFVAVEAEKLFAVEAKERQGARTDIKAKLPEGSKGQARDKAAGACDVSPRYVQDAKKIAAKSPETAAAAKTGTISMAEAKRAVLKSQKKSLRVRYSEPDFFARIARCVDGVLLNHPLLDELLAIKKSDWTNEAAKSFPHIIARLEEASTRADEYARKLKSVAKRYGKKAA
jgi:hypothetical protein